MTVDAIKLPPLKGAERKKIARWAILAKEPACRGGYVVGLGGCLKKIASLTSLDRNDGGHQSDPLPGGAWGGLRLKDGVLKNNEQRIKK